MINKKFIFSVARDYFEPVSDVYYKLKHFVGNTFYVIVNFIDPPHPRFHKVYPRGKRRDFPEVIEEVAFAIILDFWYEEVVDGPVDWNSDESHFAFYIWLKSSVCWIENELPKLEKEKEELFDKLHDPQTIQKLADFETEINNKKTSIIKVMCLHRDSFWT